MSKQRILIIGISGVTCGGKTTTATELNNSLPNSKMFSQDDYFLQVDDPRHTRIPELNHINFDILSSLDMDKMTEDVKNYIGEFNKKKVITNGVLNCTAQQNGHIVPSEPLYSDLRMKCYNKVKNKDVHLVIVEGFCIFNHPPLVDLIDLKYYFTLERDVCFQRRKKRVYEPPDCPGYFDLCAWPEHLKQLQEVQENVKNVIYFDKNVKNPVEEILKDILQVLK